MVPRKIDNKTTITVNCGSVCQKTTLAAGGIISAIIGVPIAIMCMLLYGRGLYELFCWVLQSHDPYGNPLAALGATFGPIITVGLGIAVVIFAFSE